MSSLLFCSSRRIVTTEPQLPLSGTPSVPSRPPTDQLASTAATVALVMISLAIALGIVWAFRMRQVVNRWQPVVQAQPTVPTFQTMLNHLVSSGDDSIRLADFDSSAESVAALCSVERLRVIRLDGGQLDAAATAAFAQLPHLEQLHLRDVTLDDSGLNAFRPAAHLRVLNLAATDVSADAIRGLNDLPKLRQLRLQVRGGSSDYALAVARLTNLRAVHLIGIAVDNDTLKPIVDLPHLESLYIDDGQVTDAGWVWLFEQKPNLHVHIDQQHHDRDPQKH